jgi:RNA polymerase sigma-70 factor, ECF subfamily
MVRDEESALDVAQEVFIRAYQELPCWRGEARLGSWLYRTAVLVCFEQLRSEQKQVRLRAKAVVSREMEVSPEHHVAIAERDALIRKAISVLPPRQRAIVILKQFKSLRFSEIASLLGITEGGAKANYHRALISLRQNMQQVLAEVA